MSENTKDKIAVCNNAGKTAPAATAPMANAYANDTVLEKIENLAATFRHKKCNETSSRFLFLNIKGNDKSYKNLVSLAHYRTKEISMCKGFTRTDFSKTCWKGKTCSPKNRRKPLG